MKEIERAREKCRGGGHRVNAGEIGALVRRRSAAAAVLCRPREGGGDLDLEGVRLLVALLHRGRSARTRVKRAGAHAVTAARVCWRVERARVPHRVPQSKSVRVVVARVLHLHL